MVLTAEQLERIARNKAEADRRRAMCQAKLQKASFGEFSAVQQPSTSSAAQTKSSASIIYSRTSEPACAQTPFAVPSSNFLHRTAALNLEKAGRSSHSGGLTMDKESVLLPDSRTHPVPRPQAIVQFAPPVDPNIKKDINISFHLADSTRFRVHFTPYHSSVVTALKGIPSHAFDSQTRQWLFLLKDVKLVEDKLYELNEINATVQTLPHHLIQWLERSNQSILGKDPVLEGMVDDSLLRYLFPYQRRGVIFGVQKRGRLLLADEMGLGKSIQALGIARFFKADWPLLIVCPSSVKYTWMEQIKMFLPAVSNIVLIEKGSDPLPREKSSRTAVILSYDLMVTKREHLIEYGFQTIIFDESHLLKDGMAQRTKAATDIARKALRTILLTGTPALSRPAELYSQLRIIDPKLFPNFRDFAIRYCDGRQGRFNFEAKGCTNSEELSIILMNNIMLRRLKKDVLNDLPAKRQEVVFLSDIAVRATLDNLRKAKAAYKHATDNESRHQCLVEYYYETGIAKASSVAKHVIDNFFYEGAPRRKVLVFAHHQIVLDTLSMSVTKKGLRSIRIDGTTTSKLRDEQCQLFQKNEDVVVAILSLTAAGIGITLTAATVVVFAELHWNPGTLKQAEDRAHRVGQTDSVFVQYLIAKGTADDVMWPLIQKKLDVLGSCKLSSDTYRDAESVEKTVSQSQGIVEYFPLAKKSKFDGEN